MYGGACVVDEGDKSVPFSMWSHCGRRKIYMHINNCKAIWFIFLFCPEAWTIMKLVSDNMNVSQGNGYGVEIKLGKILSKDWWDILITYLQ